MSRIGFEPAISVLERTKIVYALDRAAAVIGLKVACLQLIKLNLA
jgi:hypothetical protein